MLDINKLNFSIDNVISDFSSEDEKSWIRDIVIELNKAIQNSSQFKLDFNSRIKITDMNISIFDFQIFVQKVLNQSYPKQVFNVKYDRFTDLYVLRVTLKNSIRN